MRTEKINLRAEVSSRAGVAEYLAAPGDAVLISRGSPRWLILSCPCGCGEEIPVNLDQRSGKAWRLYRSPTTGMTLFPSVWRDTGCESHFIIWRDRILMFGVGEHGLRDPVRFDVGALTSKVMEAWPAKGLLSYVDVADSLGEIPWDVQDACRKLATQGLLIEGVGNLRGAYRRP